MSLPARLAPQPTLDLPGSANDYQVEVVSFGDDAASTVTRVTSISSSVPSFSQDIEGLTEINFADTVDNAVTVTDDELPLEMIYLAQAAYARAENASTFHDAFPLAYDKPAQVAQLVALATDAAIERGWHALSAAELGMAAADFDTAGTLKFSLQGGFYQAIDTADTLAGDPSEANAVLFTGVVDGETVLTISFTGTDQLADTADYGDFGDHYEKFAPLVAAVKAYINDADNGIDQVLVSGHSLGAAMVQYFMDAFDGDDRFEAWTAGSPGADNESQQEPDPRTTNFIEIDDPVTYAPFLSSPAVRELFKEFIDGEFQGDTELIAILDALIDSPETKFRNGTDIIVDAGDATPHSIAGYITAIEKYLDGGTATPPGPILVKDNAAGGQDAFALTAAALKDFAGTDKHDAVSFVGAEDVRLGAKVEDLVLAAGSRAPGQQRAIGNELANHITADTGRQALRGDLLADTLEGGAGNDRLAGNNLTDKLFGGDGDDLLIGGRNADELTGGEGADTFAYAHGVQSRSYLADTILDFSAADGDRIDLAEIFDGALVFLGADEFRDRAGQVRFVVDGADGRLSADLNGDRVADFEVLLRGVTKLAAEDLLL